MIDINNILCNTNINKIYINSQKVEDEISNLFKTNNEIILGNMDITNIWKLDNKNINNLNINGADINKTPNILKYIYDKKNNENNKYVICGKIIDYITDIICIPDKYTIYFFSAWGI